SQESTLHLLPLLCNVAAFGLFYFFLRKVASPWVVTLGLAMFAFNNHLIRYAAEFKPYSGDIMSALIIILLFLKLPETDYPLVGARLFGLWTAIILWFSFTSVFVIFPLLLWACLQTALRGDRGAFRRLIIPLYMAVFSFLLVLKQSVMSMLGDPHIMLWWKGHGGYFP